MSKIAIVTDSNSGITQSMAKKMGVYVLPMPFFINGELFLEDITLSQAEFYKCLEKDADISTSQPSPKDVTDLWDEVLKEYDEVVHIPMSSGLSASCETAMALAQDYDGKVQVVDNLRISITQKMAVKDAKKLVSEGKSAAQIKEILEERKLHASIYITLETLKYLKKGGRITPAAAAIGTILNLKPVLQIQGDKLDAYSKARGKNKAKNIMIDAIKKDLDSRFSEQLKAGKIAIMGAYTGNEEEALEWKKELEKEFQTEVDIDPLSLSVACHIGYGALAVVAVEYI
ncbi:MAG: DegV family protein [Lachnospiraceae bacterium]|nr:DegV family protein [Lachnospiraceae bacterium]